MLASETVKEIIWIKSLLNEISKYLELQMTVVYIKNAEFHKRTKQIDVRFPFKRDRDGSNEFRLEFVNSFNLIADILTKALIKPQYCT